MAIRIQKAFINNNKFALRKLVAAFLGMESVNMKNIDATL